jgi:HD superfamily phosphohydrolase
MWSLYNPSIPDFICQLAETPAMQRLKDVGMHCGCEYTSFPMFTGLDSYSRHKHSVGCALIVWHFTQDRRQTIAALLHDIATPTFAHVVDFLNGDHLKQESTENGTVNIIASSPEIMTRLKEWNIELEEVADYHVYPIADNDSPKLSADRLEYTLSNLVNYRITPTEKIKEWYDHLMVGKNEEGEDELMFDDFQIAEAFCLSALETSKIYVADEDRFAMQTLSELLCKHITRGVLSKNDLYRTESEVIALLQQDEEARQDWERFRALRHIHKGNHAGAKTVLSKRRYINPYLNGKGRMVHLSDMFAQALEPFLSQRLDEPLWGE